MADNNYQIIDYIRVANTVILAIVLVTVVTILAKRKQLKHLTCSIKLSLVFYAITIVAKLTHLVLQRYDVLLPEIMEVVLAALFLTNHWIFTWHFLEAACMMKVTFREHDLRQLSLMSKRKRQLMMLNIVGHAVLLSIYLSFVMIACFCFFGKFLIVYHSTMAILMWALAAVSMLAMRHIHRNQKSLEQMQVYANKTLIIVYFLFWLGAALAMTINSILLIKNGSHYGWINW